MKLDRQQVYDKYDGRCSYCGEQIELKQMQVDHLMPQYWLTLPNPKVTKEQVYCFENLMPSCRVCNKNKDTYPLETWREMLQTQVERIRKYQASFRVAERFGLVQEINKKVVFYFETLTTRKGQKKERWKRQIS